MKLSTLLLFGVALLLLLTGTTGVLAQEYGSYYQGRKVYYTPSTTQVLVQFTDAAALARRSQAPASLGAQAVQALTALPGVALLKMNPSQTSETIQQLVAQLNLDADVAHAAPVLLNAAGEPFGGVTDQFIVKLKASTSRADLQKLLAQTGAVLHHQYEFEEHTFYLSVDKSKGDALTLANRFYESGLFEYAEPNFVLFVQPTTNDYPLYQQQWALNNTGPMGANVTAGATPDADMDVVEAWDITTGSSNIRVAVLDNGVELDHPDLRNQLNLGYDATGSGTNGGPTYSADPAKSKDTGEGHGTSCAGIVAAQANDGIGVAYLCRLVPVLLNVAGQPFGGVTDAS